jgi:hypothetical protein
MEDTTHYTYTPIDHDHLRMIRFVEDGDHLSAVLETFPAKASYPKYTALSYTWALTAEGPVYDWSIHIGQLRLPALASLYPLVEALRSNGTLLDGTWWWIDSICVDQSNLEERGAHVRRMKEIYQDADKVVVWLGEETDDSVDAPDFIDFLGKLNDANHSNDTLRTILLQDQYRDKWATLTAFFLRKWWTRVWTIQEFVIPENVIFWYGLRPLTRDKIFAALCMGDRCNAPGFKDTIAFHHAFNRRRAWLLYESARKSGRDLSLSLLALVAYFCNCEATDDHDRLYGLTGLCHDDHGISIDYTSSVEAIYLEFAKSFIARHKSLDIIAFASLFIATPGSSIPSWVPDWRARREPLVVPLMVSQSATNFLGNLRPPRLLENKYASACYSASGSAEVECEFHGSSLLARGCVVDVVQCIAGQHDSVAGQRFRTHMHNAHGVQSPVETLASVCRSLVLDRGDRYMQHPMPIEPFFKDFTHLCLLALSESHHTVHKEFRDWFQSVRFMEIHGGTFESHLRAIHDESTASWIHSPPNQDEYVQDSFYGRFFDVVERLALRLTTTRDGRIGMVPCKAKQGDLICILFGCSVPILLRKNGQEDNFVVVGECYLDNHMQGEGVEHSRFAQRTFEIV